jgi:GH15 family glucan-1,4-alpha-glucosidase
LWVNKEAMDFGPLPAEVVREFKQSLLILRTQIGTRGEIIASTDSDILRFGRDTYGYVWPRDGALVARALEMAGYNDLVRPFFLFCGSVMTREGFLLQKFNPDRSVGSSWHPWAVDGVRRLPIQEDETALVVWALFLHFAVNRDVEFIKPLYRPLVIKAADFLARYRDSATGLPLPSYDLWEERYGIHTFTCSTVVGGLEAAAALAEAFGETEYAGRYRQAAGEIRAGVLRHLWSDEAGRFGRTLYPQETGGTGAGGPALDLTIDASLLSLAVFGMFDADDPKVVATVDAVERRLWVQGPIGGLARYENDAYFQISKDITGVPGNPWIICTLWLAEYYLQRANTETDMARPLELLTWAANRALPSGVLAEQVHPYDGTPLSVSPLTWSHGEFVHAVLRYLDRLHALHLCPNCGRPTYRRQESHLIRAHSPAAQGVIGDPAAPSKEPA